MIAKLNFQAGGETCTIEIEEWTGGDGRTYVLITDKPYAPYGITAYIEKITNLYAQMSEMRHPDRVVWIECDGYTTDLLILHWQGHLNTNVDPVWTPIFDAVVTDHDEIEKALEGFVP